MNDFRPSLSEDTYTPDDLIVDASLLVSRSVTIVSGENVTRGAVLGKVTASGKYRLSLSGSVDGSETPVAILAEDTDASAADKEGLIYEAGVFNERKLTIGTGHTLASIRDGLRDLGIHLKDSVGAIYS